MIKGKDSGETGLLHPLEEPLLDTKIEELEKTEHNLDLERTSEEICSSYLQRTRSDQRP